MKQLVTIAITLMCVLWVVAIAILSIQNVFIMDATGESTLVSLKFLGRSSIRIPLGVTLALSAATGMLCTSLILPLVAASPTPSSHRRDDRRKR